MLPEATSCFRASGSEITIRTMLASFTCSSNEPASCGGVEPITLLATCSGPPTASVATVSAPNTPHAVGGCSSVPTKILRSMPDLISIFESAPSAFLTWITNSSGASSPLLSRTSTACNWFDSTPSAMAVSVMLATAGGICISDASVAMMASMFFGGFRVGLIRLTPSGISETRMDGPLSLVSVTISVSTAEPSTSAKLTSAPLSDCLASSRIRSSIASMSLRVSSAELASAIPSFEFRSD